ncbi:hypothetical protein CBR_g7984 [Chara braunii]|uniref:Integrase catalytic domain-containing protein n=1 Tax=Chara braunii TaxID=69332 RepID=A0A388KKV8_CHABU|nr:hypothetical protein CBR_g7984 [Chara braunii]|eukprot:GBG70684.1 hypothetical protein CBR_g7984 [Chara braunii]
MIAKTSGDRKLKLNLVPIIRKFEVSQKWSVTKHTSFSRDGFPRFVNFFEVVPTPGPGPNCPDPFEPGEKWGVGGKDAHRCTSTGARTLSQNSVRTMSAVEVLKGRKPPFRGVGSMGQMWWPDQLQAQLHHTLRESGKVGLLSSAHPPRRQAWEEDNAVVNTKDARLRPSHLGDPTVVDVTQYKAGGRGTGRVGDDLFHEQQGGSAHEKRWTLNQAPGQNGNALSSKADVNSLRSRGADRDEHGVIETIAQDWRPRSAAGMLDLHCGFRCGSNRCDCDDDDVNAMKVAGCRPSSGFRRNGALKNGDVGAGRCFSAPADPMSRVAGGSNTGRRIGQVAELLSIKELERLKGILEELLRCRRAKEGSPDVRSQVGRVVDADPLPWVNGVVVPRPPLDSGPSTCCEGPLDNATEINGSERELGRLTKLNEAVCGSEPSRGGRACCTGVVGSADIGNHVHGSGRVYEVVRGVEKSVPLGDIVPHDTRLHQDANQGDMLETPQLWDHGLEEGRNGVVLQKRGLPERVRGGVPVTAGFEKQTPNAVENCTWMGSRKSGGELGRGACVCQTQQHPNCAPKLALREKKEMEKARHMEIKEIERRMASVKALMMKIRLHNVKLAAKKAQEVSQKATTGEAQERTLEEPKPVVKGAVAEDKRDRRCRKPEAVDALMMKIRWHNLKKLAARREKEASQKAATGESQETTMEEPKAVVKGGVGEDERDRRYRKLEAVDALMMKIRRHNLKKLAVRREKEASQKTAMTASQETTTEKQKAVVKGRVGEDKRYRGCRRPEAVEALMMKIRRHNTKLAARRKAREASQEGAMAELQETTTDEAKAVVEGDAREDERDGRGRKGPSFSHEKGKGGDCTKGQAVTSDVTATPVKSQGSGREPKKVGLQNIEQGDKKTRPGQTALLSSEMGKEGGMQKATKAGVGEGVINLQGSGVDTAKARTKSNYKSEGATDQSYKSLLLSHNDMRKEGEKGQATTNGKHSEDGCPKPQRATDEADKGLTKSEKGGKHQAGVVVADRLPNTATCRLMGGRGHRDANPKVPRVREVTTAAANCSPQRAARGRGSTNHHLKRQESQVREVEDGGGGGGGGGRGGMTVKTPAPGTYVVLSGSSISKPSVKEPECSVITSKKVCGREERGSDRSCWTPTRVAESPVLATVVRESWQDELTECHMAELEGGKPVEGYRVSSSIEEAGGAKSAHGKLDLFGIDSQAVLQTLESENPKNQTDNQTSCSVQLQAMVKSGVKAMAQSFDEKEDGRVRHVKGAPEAVAVRSSCDDGDDHVCHEEAENLSGEERRLQKQLQHDQMVARDDSQSKTMAEYLRGRGIPGGEEESSQDDNGKEGSVAGKGSRLHKEWGLHLGADDQEAVRGDDQNMSMMRTIEEEEEEEEEEDEDPEVEKGDQEMPTVAIIIEGGIDVDHGTEMNRGVVSDSNILGAAERARKLEHDGGQVICKERDPLGGGDKCADTSGRQDVHKGCGSKTDAVRMSLECSLLRNGVDFLKDKEGTLGYTNDAERKEKDFGRGGIPVKVLVGEVGDVEEPQKSAIIGEMNTEKRTVDTTKLSRNVMKGYLRSQQPGKTCATSRKDGIARRSSKTSTAKVEKKKSAIPKLLTQEKGGNAAAEVLQVHHPHDRISTKEGIAMEERVSSLGPVLETGRPGARRNSPPPGVQSVRGIRSQGESSLEALDEALDPADRALDRAAKSMAHLPLDKMINIPNEGATTAGMTPQSRRNVGESWQEACLDPHGDRGVDWAKKSGEHHLPVDETIGICNEGTSTPGKSLQSPGNGRSSRQGGCLDAQAKTDVDRAKKSGEHRLAVDEMIGICSEGTSMAGSIGQVLDDSEGGKEVRVEKVDCIADTSLTSYMLAKDDRLSSRDDMSTTGAMVRGGGRSVLTGEQDQDAKLGLCSDLQVTTETPLTQGVNVVGHREFNASRNEDRNAPSCTAVPSQTWDSQDGHTQQTKAIRAGYDGPKTTTQDARIPAGRSRNSSNDKFAKDTLDQILNAMHRPGIRPAVLPSLPFSAMTDPYAAQFGPSPSCTSATTLSQIVGSSTSGPAAGATPQPPPISPVGQQQPWYPKTPLKPPPTFLGDKKDEALDTWLRTVPVWVRAKRTLVEEEVITVASYLEDSAARWVNGASKGFDKNMGDWAKTHTLESFMDLVEARWHNPQQAQIATDGLLKLDSRKPFVVTIDASQYGIGALLAQQEGKQLRPVEYMSKKMSSKKLAKSTYERELYALYKALVHWRPYLLRRFFYLGTDHQTLKWIKTQPVLSDALKRWIEVIDQYDFKLDYVKGEYNKVADALSRRADYLGALIYEFGLSEDVTRSLGEAYKQDPIAMDIINKLQAKDKATSDEFVMLDGLLFLEKAGFKRLVVPSREILRSLFLGECHDATGHFGYKKTSANLVQRFWWPNTLDDAKKYVQTCQVCLRDKPRTQAPLGLLKPLPIPAGLGQSISMDFMDTLVTSKNGKRHIFVMVDRFTKFARLIVMPETTRIEHVIKLFMDNWVRDLGFPKTIVSDRDVHFTSEMWKKTAEQMGRQLRMTYGNHPEANGQAEQMNCVVQHLLRHYIKPSQDDGDEKLPLIASLYNNVVHNTTGVTPNQLHLGWKPRSALDFLLPENRTAATPGTIEFGVQYEKLLQQTVEHIRKSQEAMFASENKHR